KRGSTASTDEILRLRLRMTCPTATVPTVEILRLRLRMTCPTETVPTVEILRLRLRMTCPSLTDKSVGRRFCLALDRGLAHQHRLALQAVQRLDELEVFGAAEFDRRLRLAVARGEVGLELLARFLARLLAGLVLLLGALAALQVLVEIGLARAQRREQVPLGGLVEHDVGHDALGLDRRAARRVVAGGGDLERRVGGELAHRL